MNADGTEPRRLARGGWPSWSTDSAQVYFHSRLEEALCSISIAGSGCRAEADYGLPESLSLGVTGQSTRGVSGKRIPQSQGSCFASRSGRMACAVRHLGRTRMVSHGPGTVPGCSAAARGIGPACGSTLSTATNRTRFSPVRSWRLPGLRTARSSSSPCVRRTSNCGLPLLIRPAPRWIPWVRGRRWPSTGRTCSASTRAESKPTRRMPTPTPIARDTTTIYASGPRLVPT